MSESTLAFLIAAGILLVLALFVPCIDSLAGMLRRRPRMRDAAAEAQPAKPYRRDVA